MTDRETQQARDRAAKIRADGERVEEAARNKRKVARDRAVQAERLKLHQTKGWKQ